MTYSRKQLNFRFARGLFFGVLAGVVLALVARPFVAKLPFIGDGSAVQKKMTKAEKQAKELRDQAAKAKGSADASEEDLKSIAAGEADEAKAIEQTKDTGGPSEDPSTGGTETNPAEEGDTPSSDPVTEPPPSTGGTRRVYEDTSAGFSLTLPSGWVSEVSGGQVQLKPENAPSSDGHDDTPAGLLVRTRSKSASASLRDVYNGKVASNYFADAAHGSSEGTVNGHPSVTFRGVAGFESTTITVVDLGSTVVEIHDQGERRQSDGTFAQVVASFQTK